MNEQIVMALLLPDRFEKLAQTAMQANKLQSIEAARALVQYEIHFYGSRLSKIDWQKVSTTLPVAIDFFLEVLQVGMSFSTEANHVYLAPNFQNSTKLDCIRTYEGNIFLAQKAGSISHVTHPVMVYEGEPWNYGTNESGKQVVLHKGTPGTDKPRIVGGYVFIVRPNGEREPFWLDLDDISRLKAKSKRPALYTAYKGGIDPGFLATKLVNHGLKYVPKVKVNIPLDGSDDNELDAIESPANSQQQYTATSPVTHVQAPTPSIQPPVPHLYQQHAQYQQPTHPSIEPSWGVSTPPMPF